MDKLRAHFAREGKYYLLAVGFSALMCLLCIPVTTVDHINYDSSYQYALTRHSLPEIWALIPADFSPPLYTLLLKAFTLLAGDSLFSMRMFNVLLLIGMQFLAMFPIRRAFDTRVSLVCAVGYACSALNFDNFIHEIRPTVLGYFTLTGTAVYAYLAFQKKERRDLVGFTVFCIAAMYTHYIALIAAVGFYVVLLAGTLLHKDLRQTRRFFVSGCIAAVCYLPWLSVVLHQLGNVKEHYWEAEFSGVGYLVHNIFDTPFSSSLSPYVEDVIWGVVKLLLLLYLLRAVNIRRIREIKDPREIPLLSWSRTWARFTPLLFFFLLIAAAMAIFVFMLLNVHPFQADRYLFMFTGIPILMAAVLVTRLDIRWGPAALAAVIAANGVLNTGLMWHKKSESDLLDIIALMREQHPDGDISIIHDHEWSLGIMIYYFPEAKHYVHKNTHTVLTTFDVFPCEVRTLDAPEDIAAYTDDFYVFNIHPPDAKDLSYSHYVLDDRFDCEPLLEASDMYSYQEDWRLVRVRVK
ncbi:MAG: glycosyltransferase family 39 protein [Oscillospiraceae bacterium]|nr:glycosyltransferase family 39 protein [Oscillospiraceae bacterium]